MIDRITCVRLPSPTGMRLLHSKGLRFDAIYVDGSHDYIDVFIDIALSLAVASDRGVVFGDDYQIGSVRDAVSDFCAENGLEFSTLPTTRIGDGTRQTYWMIRPA